MASLGFRFMSKAPASSTVSLLANCVWHYPPDEVLRAPYFVYNQDSQRVAEFLSHMTPDNCVVFYSSKVRARVCVRARARSFPRVAWSEWVVLCVRRSS